MRIYLVGRQQVDVHSLESFLEEQAGVTDWMPDSGSGGEALCEIGGRCCYRSFQNPRPGGTKAYLANIIKQGHDSVLEHAVWSFILTGVSRSLMAELTRHRTGISFSILSQRYVDESDSSVIKPSGIPAEGEEYQEWATSCANSKRAYNRLCQMLEVRFSNIENATERRKAVRQAARSVLPGCTETVIFLTVNARELRHILKLRGSRHADPEIRSLAVKLVEIMRQEAPCLFGDLKVVDGEVVQLKQ